MQSFKNTIFIIKAIGSRAKGVIILASTICIFMSVVDNAYIISLNQLYKEVAQKNFSTQLLVVFVITGILLLLADALNGVINYISVKEQYLLEQGYEEYLFNTVNKITPYMYQEPKVLDLLKGVREGKDGTVLYLFNLMMILMLYVPYFLGIMVFLYMLNPILAIVLFLSFLPTIVSWKVRRTASYNVENDSGCFKRRMEAFQTYVSRFPWLQETRFWRMEGVFFRQFKKEALCYKEHRKSFYKKRCAIDCVTTFFYVLGIAVVLGTLVLLIDREMVSGTEVATVLTVILSVYERMNIVLNHHVAEVMDYSGCLRTFKSFVELTKPNNHMDVDNGKRLDLEQLTEIEMEKVHFRYPNGEKEALKEISFVARTGDIIAIVGENGSGKSTLSKVLATLFLPESGTLNVNGEKIESYNIESIRNRIAVVQQDFQKYPFTISENILLSDANEDELVMDLLDKVDLTGNQKHLSNNISPQTLVSKEFGGVELSGGQWQRIAIARAANKKSDLLIFDEPTSAIDPIEEVNIMKMLIELCQDKIAILITHRIGAARLADTIIVMQEGSVCEQGTHEELMRKKGKYYQMYKTQEQWYTK